MPAAVGSIIDGKFEGRLLCRRRFGCPTCLDPHERVWLLIERPVLSGEANLNSEPLGRMNLAQHLVEFDITSRLRERNELILDFEIVPPESTDEMLFADVRLEIRG
ncbi:MAG: hypothetical protein WD894_19715 [Pirellulales bacterium]